MEERTSKTVIKLSGRSVIDPFALATAKKRENAKLQCDVWERY